MNAGSTRLLTRHTRDSAPRRPWYKGSSFPIRSSNGGIALASWKTALESRTDEDLPEKLEGESIQAEIPWLYNYKLDFRFR